MTAEQLLKDWVTVSNEYRQRRMGLELAENAGAKDRTRALLGYHRAGLALSMLELDMIEFAEAAATKAVEP